MAVDFDEAKVRRGGSALWLGWAFATMIGMALGYLPSALFVEQVDLGLARVVVPLLAGLLIGLMQWLVLRNYLTHCGDWVFNMVGSWMAAYTVGLFVVSFFARSVIAVALAYILFGVIVAVIQWPVLRREIPQLWMWILANVVGWTLGGLAAQGVMLLLFGDNPPSLLASTLVNAAVTGLVAGLITGLALVRIVREPDRPYVEPALGGGANVH